MKTVLCLLLVVCLPRGGWATEPTQLTWRRIDQHDTLLVNKTLIEYREGEALEALADRISKAAGATDQTNWVVTVPQKNDQFADRMPKLEGGNLHFIFDALTAPERNVTYFYGSRKVKRYKITCSDKNTANDPERAEYWIDGVALGPWSQAKKKFEDINWEKGAVADILMDGTHPLVAIGIGMFHIPRDLEYLLFKHEVWQNVHLRFRNPYEK